MASRRSFAIRMPKWKLWTVCAECLNSDDVIVMDGLQTTKDEQTVVEQRHFTFRTPDVCVTVWYAMTNVSARFWYGMANVP